jgi:tyrosyl-tRNA synthetase
MNRIDEQVSTFMHGSEFGDPQIREMMTHELRQRLVEAEKEGRPLRVYCGYDVTAPDIHLGHTVTMRKLRQFQEYGHEVTFVIGIVTSLIGDPSDHDQARKPQTMEQIMLNARTYAQQAFKILDRQKTTVRYNHEWLNNLTFPDVINLASKFTVQQFLVRDRLHARLEKNEPLWLSELLYPLAQGYDAAFLKADVQIGATEQLFNLMAGRKIQETYGLKPQICITFPILLGTDGKEKMSKSLGNYIGIDEPADIQYAKIMSLPDEQIIPYFDLVTRWPREQIDNVKTELEQGRLHPMELKKKLAWEIADIFNGQAAADAAAEEFTRVHQERELPGEMAEYCLPKTTNILELLVDTGLCASKSEAKRAIQQGSVKLDGKKVDEPDLLVQPCRAVLQKGRRSFVRLVREKE